MGGAVGGGMGIPIGGTIIGVTMERPRGEGRIMEEVFRKAIGGNPGAVGGAIADRGGIVGRVIGALVGMLGGAVAGAIEGVTTYYIFGPTPQEHPQQ